jgi:hypothetical protein
MRKIFNNKKGIGLVVFGIAVMILLAVIGIFFVVFDGIADTAYDIAEDYVDSPNATAMITGAQAKTNVWWDSAFLFLFIGIWIGGLLISYYSDDYGKFILVFMIFILSGILFGVGELQDYWMELVEDSDNIASPDEYPNIHFIMNNYLWIWLVILASSMIVMVVRDR